MTKDTTKEYPAHEAMFHEWYNMSNKLSDETAEDLRLEYRHLLSRLEALENEKNATKFTVVAAHCECGRTIKISQLTNAELKDE